MQISAATQRWPDGWDGLATAGFLLLALGLPALGYVMLVADVRAYLRSLRRALVRLADWKSAAPGWALTQTPRCLEVFGLKLPCREEELLAAYRQRVKELHPDHGGDKRQFLRLQAYFEEARQLLGQPIE